MAANHADVQFEQRKRSGIEAISVCELDKSPKGSVDLPIRDLVNLINLHRDYCTTSSCSGRISLFHTGGEETTAKGRGFWFLALHRSLESPTELERALATGLAANPSPSSITLFKHEPFVLHVLCRTVPLAQAMLLVARESGFRESGISSSNDNKIILAVRTTSNVLEVPVAFNGESVCPPEYLIFLSQQANLKFAENVKRVDHFYQGLQALFHSQAPSQTPAPTTLPTIWRPMENCKFKRWGHVCVVLDQYRVLLFGGWKENARTNDTGIWDSRHGTISPVESSILPPALVYHTATKVGSADVLVFGGRTSPQSPSSELWKFASERWELIPSDLGPVARFRHAACSEGNSLFVFGGRAVDGQTLGDLWEFTNDKKRWQQVMTLNEGPGRVFAHAMVAFGGKLYVHGGLTNDLTERKDSRVHVLDLHTKVWAVAETGEIPWRFSHNWVGNFAKPSETFMSGGVLDQCSAKVLGLEEALQIDLEAGVNVKHLQFTCECELLAVQHSFAVLDQDTMVVFGGGATCFAFGSVYSPSAQLALGDELESTTAASAAGQLYLKCIKPQAVQVKKMLEQLEALDKSRKVEHVDQFLCFPVLFPVNSIPDTEITSLQPSTRIKTDTKQQQQQVEHDLCVRLFGSATGKVERVDDVLLVPGTLGSVGESDWKLLLSLYPGSTRVVQRERVNSNAMRQSRNTLVYSSMPPTTTPECWVTRVENGVTFSFDMLQVMYSKGNVLEKLRFSQLVQPGETVLDLFAGIGYFTLPALKLAKSSKVYSCELNKHSVRALRRNLVLNGIDPIRSQVFPGDCRNFTKENFADRISLGLLPNARVGFPIACRAVVNGGWMHIHENVNESDVDSWGISMAQEITTLLNSLLLLPVFAHCHDHPQCKS
ncbi:hypothetical protein BASA81_008442 [Batrachochytrium salamandrivorans]|nr:hypothetical protein BASA81_008442 [Batrachochytrium salamandrivorans]